jgi:hypothetical protein
MKKRALHKSFKPFSLFWFFDRGEFGHFRTVLPGLDLVLQVLL